MNVRTAETGADRSLTDAEVTVILARWRANRRDGAGSITVRDVADGLGTSVEEVGDLLTASDGVPTRARPSRQQPLGIRGNLVYAVAAVLGFGVGFLPLWLFMFLIFETPVALGIVATFGVFFFVVFTVMGLREDEACHRRLAELSDAR